MQRKTDDSDHYDAVLAICRAQAEESPERTVAALQALGDPTAWANCVAWRYRQLDNAFHLFPDAPPHRRAQAYAEVRSRYGAAFADLARLARLALDAGFPPDAQDEDDRTPLCRVLSKLRSRDWELASELALAHELLRRGADLSLCNEGVRRPKSVYHRLQDNLTRFMVGLQAPGWIALVEALIDAGMDVGEAVPEPLVVRAALENNLPLVRLLLARGPDLQTTIDRGKHTIWERIVRDASFGRQRDTLLALIASGASPDLPDADGMTFLMRACEKDDLGEARALLDAGADPRATTTRGKAILCALSFADSETMIATLLEHGASPDAWRPAGKLTALQAAMDREAKTCAPSGVDWLLMHGADISLGGGRPGSPFARAIARAEDFDPHGVERLLEHVPAQVERCAVAELAKAGDDPEREGLLEQVASLSRQVVAGNRDGLKAWVDELGKRHARQHDE